MQFCMDCFAVERVESSHRPLPSSKIKTNTVGNSVPEIRAIEIKNYPCVSKNGVLGEPCPKGYVLMCIMES